MRKSIPIWMGAAGVVAGVAMLLGRVGLASSPTIFGTGRNPTTALTVTADGGADGGPVQSINAYAALTQTAAPGATSLVVDNASLFAAGSTAMVWQATGLTAPGLDAGWQTDASTDAGYATTPLNFDITSNQVGNYEWVLISSTNLNTNTLTLSQPISSVYGGYAAGFSQVITVPAYTTVTVNPGAILAPAMPWNGVKGGVLVFTAQSVVNNGTILADGYGFRGGVLRNQGAGLQNPNGGPSPNIFGCSALLGWVGSTGGIFPSAGGAHKGEGIVPGSWFNELADGGTTYTNDAAAPSDPTYFSYGYGNIANGAGGGNCHNSGGGGGGNGSPGGNGSLTFNGDQPVASRAVGGIGGSALTYSTVDHLSFGGGGGAGEENNYVGTAGGNGGGIVFIQAGTISGTGTFRSNGMAPPLAVAPYSSNVGSNLAGNDGAGGGGAGGVVVLRATATACGSASANGGLGGNVNGGDGNSGQGGGGGVGRLDIQPSGGCTPVLVPGTPGGETSVVPPPTGGATGVLLDASSVPNTNLTVSTSPSGATFDASACTPAQIAAGYCDGCSSNADCTVTPATPVCNNATSICVACVYDTDCTSTPTTPYCNDGNNTGAAVTFQCVACLTNNECQIDGGTNVCQASTNTCVAPSAVGDGGTSVPTSDGGTDAGGTPPILDAGSGGTPDSGTSGGTSGGTSKSSSGGCSCRVGGSSSSGTTQASLVLALGGLVAFLRVRRPRRASR